MKYRNRPSPVGTPAKILSFSLRSPKSVLIAWGLIVLVGLFGATQLKVETSTDSVLDRTGADWAFYEFSQDLFGSDETLVVAMRGEKPFGRERLEGLGRLTNVLEIIQGVRRVDSLYSVPLIRSGVDGSLQLDASLAGGVPKRIQDLQRLREELSADRIAPASLISRDEQTFAVNVLLERDLGADFERVVHDVQQATEGHGAWVSGVPIFRTGLSKALASEISLFVVVTVVIVGFLLMLIFRSLSAVLLPLIAGGIGTLMILAAMGATGTPLTISTMILPSIMLALGCAYSMHLITAASRGGARENLEAALNRVMMPVALSGLTTSIGFLGIAAVRIDTIHQTGAFGALGVLMVTAATLTAIPAALQLWPLPKRKLALSGWLTDWVHPLICGLALRRNARIIGAAVIVVVVFGLGLTRVTLETDTTRWFPRGHEIRESYEKIRAHLSGISPMNVVITADGDRMVTETEVLVAIDALSTHLGDLPEVGKSLALTDPLRQIHGGFIGDALLPLPTSQEMVDQYLLLLEPVEHMDDVVTKDRSFANILLRVDNNGSRHLLGLAKEVDRWWVQHGPEGYRARATGIMYEFARAQNAISAGQIKGLAFALGIVAVLLFAIFRSSRLAVITLIPNVAPIVIGFGAMGLANIALDAGTVIMGSLALGIAVDDTLHVACSYQSHCESGSPRQKALEVALQQVLPALVYTTIILCAGFAVLGFSTLSVTRNLGILVAAVLSVCLVADTLLLPALLARWTHEPGGSRHPVL